MEAEEQLLGWLMHNSNLLPEVIQQLSPANFCREPHRLIWRCLQSMNEEYQTITQATLVDEILKNKSKEQFDPQEIISHLSICTPSHPTPEEHVKIILRSAEQRKYARLGLRIYTQNDRMYTNKTILDSIFSELTRMEKVRVGLAGKFKTYTWEG